MFLKKAPGVMLTAAIVSLMAAGCSPGKESAKVPTSEQSWIVSAIGQDICDVALFAASRANKSINPEFATLNTKLSGDKVSYDLKSAGGEAHADLTLEGYAWNPDNYVPLVKQLKDQFKIKSAANVKDDSFKLVESLADFTPQSLAENNRKISEALSTSPLDAEPNEEAALLCALYALRENASCFTDVRPWLNRVAAHLAIAEAATNGKPSTTAGKLSSAILLCLAGRQADSLKTLQELTVENSPAMDSWRRAIKMRVTHDYRIADLKPARLVERLEYGRALANNFGADAVSDYLVKITPSKDSAENLPVDWTRIGTGNMRSVEAGHTYALNSVSSEMNELATDLKLYKNMTPPNTDSIVAQLAEPATGCLVKDDHNVWQLQAVSWGDLASSHCRHTMDSIYQTHRFLNSMWGVKDEAQEFVKKSDQTFRRLPMYALCKLDIAKESDGKIPEELIDAVGTLSHTTPEVIPFTLWKIASKRTTPEILENPGSWFAPLLLPGTTFEFEARVPSPGLKATDLEKLKNLAPFNRKILVNYVTATYDTKHPGLNGRLGDEFFNLLTGTLQPLLDYDTSALETIRSFCWTDDRKRWVPIQERICKLEPGEYYTLANYLQNKEPAKAAAAYEKAIKFGRDQVQFANSCGWLVDYNYTHDKKKEAEALAQRAAEVYSHAGLETMASLCERMGKLTEAEKYFDAIQERYGDDDDIGAFYIRHKQDPKYKAKAEAFINKVWPGGIKKSDPATLQGPPTKGVCIDSVSYRTDELGMKPGCIVVGVNGYEVANTKQYTVARQLRNGDLTEFTFWPGPPKYITAKGALAGGRLSCDISNYPKSGH